MQSFDPAEVSIFNVVQQRRRHRENKRERKHDRDGVLYRRIHCKLRRDPDEYDGRGKSSR